MSLFRVFQIALKGVGKGEGREKPPSGGGMGNFTKTGVIFSAGEHLRRSAFDHLNLFQFKKHHSVNMEHQSVCTKCTKLK